MEKKDKSKFFINGNCTDPAYRSTRDNPQGIQHRNFVEELWSKYEKHAESNFRTEAQRQFLQRFWEMYLWNTFLRRGFEIIKHDKHKGKCPDLCLKIADHTVWIEATAPNAGTTADRVPEIQYCKNLDDPVAFDVPEEKIILRYTNALDVKLKQYRIFCEENIVKPTDSYIIAINSGNIPHVVGDQELPYYVRAFLPFGNLTVDIDTKSLKRTEAFYRTRNHVEKLNGEKIDTQSFLIPEYNGISAILHSTIDCTKSPNLGFSLGHDFDILCNPTAKNPLPKEMLSKLSWCTNKFYNNGELQAIPPSAL